MTAPSFRLIAATSADAVTFAAFAVLLPSHVAYAEQNPVILAMMSLGGVGLVLAIKIGFASTIAALYEITIRKPHVKWRDRVSMSLITVIMSIGAAIGIAGAGFNVASLLMNV